MDLQLPIEDRFSLWGRILIEAPRRCDIRGPHVHRSFGFSHHRWKEPNWMTLVLHSAPNLPDSSCPSTNPAPGTDHWSEPASHTPHAPHTHRTPHTHLTPHTHTLIWSAQTIKCLVRLLSSITRVMLMLACNHPEPGQSLPKPACDPGLYPPFVWVRGQIIWFGNIQTTESWWFIWLSAWRNPLSKARSVFGASIDVSCPLFDVIEQWKGEGEARGALPHMRLNLNI